MRQYSRTNPAKPMLKFPSMYSGLARSRNLLRSPLASIPMEVRAVKPAGGIRTTKDAIRYLVAVKEVAGPEWLDPYYFRFGASSVVNDLIMQRQTQLEGHYSGSDYVTVD